MNTKIQATTPSKRTIFKRRLLWAIGLIIFIPLILGAAWFIAVWGNIDFGPQEQVGSTLCGSSGYKLLEYRTSRGNGRLDFVDPKGKVHGSVKLYEESYIGEAHWSSDCKSVTVNGPDGIEELKVSP